MRNSKPMVQGTSVWGGQVNHRLLQLYTIQLSHVRNKHNTDHPGIPKTFCWHFHINMCNPVVIQFSVPHMYIKLLKLL